MPNLFIQVHDTAFGFLTSQCTQAVKSKLPFLQRQVRNPGGHRDICAARIPAHRCTGTYLNAPLRNLSLWASLSEFTTLTSSRPQYWCKAGKGKGENRRIWCSKFVFCSNKTSSFRVLPVENSLEQSRMFKNPLILLLQAVAIAFFWENDYDFLLKFPKWHNRTRLAGFS